MANLHSLEDAPQVAGRASGLVGGHSSSFTLRSGHAEVFGELGVFGVVLHVGQLIFKSSSTML
jgi:hypothetical protein